MRPSRARPLEAAQRGNFQTAVLHFQNKNVVLALCFVVNQSFNSLRKTGSLKLERGVRSSVPWSSRVEKSTKHVLRTPYSVLRIYFDATSLGELCVCSLESDCFVPISSQLTTICVFVPLKYQWTSYLLRHAHKWQMRCSLSRKYRWIICCEKKKFIHWLKKYDL